MENSNVIDHKSGLTYSTVPAQRQSDQGWTACIVVSGKDKPEVHREFTVNVSSISKLMEDLG